MAGEREVTAALNLDTAEWDAKIDHAKMKAEELGDHKDFKLRVDSGDALAKLEAFRAATLRVHAAEARLVELRGKEGATVAQVLSAETALASSRAGLTAAANNLDRAENRLAEDHKRTTAEANKAILTHKQLQLGWLDLAAVGMGTVVPALAAILGATIGLLGPAGVAVVAFLGLRNMMADTSAATLPFRTSVKGLEADLKGLEVSVAKGVAPGLTQAFQDIQGSMPAVKTDVQGLAGQLGQVASHLLPGLVDLLLRLNPLFMTMGDLLIRGSIAFQNWAGNSSSVNTFVNYAQRQIPVVLTLLQQLVQVIAKVGSGTLLGGNTLTALGSFITLLNKLPLPVLQALAPAAAGARLAFLGWSNVISPLADGIAKMAGKVPLLASALESIPLGATGLAIAGVATVIGGVMLAIDHFAHHAHNAIQPVSELTQAIINDGDALKTNTRQWLVNQLQTEGSFDLALKLGVSQKTLTDAVMGNGHAMDILTGAMDKAQNSGGDLRKAADKLGSQLDTTSGKLAASKHAADNENAALQTASHGALTLKKSLDSIAPFKTLTLNVKDNASAQLGIIKANLEALHNRQIDVTTYVQNVVEPSLVIPSVTHDSRIPGQASGGLQGGVGTGTSDSNVIRVSKGEFIMPADATAAYLPQLQAMRSMSAAVPSSTGGFAGGGMWAGDEGDTYININIAGSVVTQQQLVRAVQQGIREDLRRRGKSVVRTL